MLSEDVYEKLAERLILRIEETNNKIITKIAQNIKLIGTLTPTQAQQIAQMLKYGGDYEKLVKEISKMTNTNIKDIKKIFEEVAKQNQEFSKIFYEVQNVPYIPYDENKALQKQVNALAEITVKEYANISRTRALGYIIRDENKKLVFRDLGYIYKDAIDRAVLSIAQGKETFNKNMYDLMKDIGSSGLRSIEFESGYTRRLDSQVRMNLLGGLRDMSNQIQKDFGKEYGSNGVEISVHEYPAPDHANVQGKQFSNEEFDNFQNDKKATSYDGVVFKPEFKGHDRRSIGEYNCYHYIFSIMLGISEPLYSKEQLREIQEKNAKGFELNGKHYTMYQGTQMQRQIETSIRQQKDIQLMAKESGNTKLMDDSERKIRELTKRYKDFSKLSGLPPKMQRLRVSSYKRVALKK